MDLNSNQLAIFRAVAEAKSFTLGADALLISQPAASKQVAALEKTLGVTLIERNSRRLDVTEAGHLLLTYAHRIAALTAEARDAMNDLSVLRRGRLRIGATPTLGTYLLPETLVYYRNRFPAIELGVEIHEGASLRHRLQDSSLDLILTTAVSNDASLQCTEIATDFMVPVCSPDFLPAAEKQLNLGQLCKHRLIIRGIDSNSLGFAERMLRTRGCEPTKIMRLPHTESVKQATLAGLGIGFLPLIAIRRELREHRLRKLTIPYFKLSRPTFWVERASETRSKAAHAYWCILKHAVRGTLKQKKSG